MTLQKLEVPEPSKFWKPTAQDSVREGQYLRMEAPKPGKEKFGASYVILDPSGTEQTLPNHETITAGMNLLKTGEYVKITFKGKKGNKYTYDFEHDPAYKSLTHDPDADRKAGVVNIMKELKSFINFWPDGIIPEANIKQVILKVGYSGTATDEMFQRLKAEGLLIYAGNGLKVV